MRGKFGLAAGLAVLSASLLSPISVAEAGVADFLGEVVSTMWRGVFRPRRVSHARGEGINGGGTFARRMQQLDTNALPVPLMIAAAGYPVETHRVTTADGYILTLHRIPPRDGNATRGVVLLQHGILCSSADWVMGAPDKSLGYILSDAGYDVWLGNFRGNVYSRSHVSLPADLKGNSQFGPASDPFWSFSFHEMGAFDIPATVDHVLSVANRSRLDAYVAHSMGTTALIVAAHLRPRWVSDRIALMVGLAPVARIDHLSSPIRHLIAVEPQVQTLLGHLGQGNAFWTPDSIQAKISRALCNRPSGFEGTSNELIRRMGVGGATTPRRRRKQTPPRRRRRRPQLTLDAVTCAIPESAIFAIAGFNQDQMNMTLLPRILGHTPSGTSFQTLEHYTQIFKTRRFAAFDHGSAAANLARYGSSVPPSYDLRRLSVPSALFWGAGDWVAAPRDVARLAAALPDVRATRRVPHPRFNHLDFLWGKDAHALVYADVLRTIDEFVDSGVK